MTARNSFNALTLLVRWQTGRASSL